MLNLHPDTIRGGLQARRIANAEKRAGGRS